MRWVVAHPGPHFSVDDVYRGWVDALRELGEQVVEFNLGDRLTFYSHAKMQVGEHVRPALTPEGAHDLAIEGIFADLYKVRPDILLVISGFFLPPECYRLARAYGTRSVVIHTETPYENDRQIKVAHYADVNLLTDRVGIEDFPPGTRYQPHAYRPERHKPGPAREEMVCDLGFVGTGYPSRVEFFEAMDLDGIDLILAGNWPLITEGSKLFPHLAMSPEECLDNVDTADLYRSARVGINLYRREAARPDLSPGWSIGPREVEMAATGLFFLRDPRGEGDEVFHMLPTFTSPGEASELLRWYLDHPDERTELASKAREAIADRTFMSHAAELLRQLDS